MEERPPCFLKSPGHRVSKTKRKQNCRFLQTLSEGYVGPICSGRDSESDIRTCNRATEETDSPFLPTTSVHPVAPRRMEKIQPVPSHQRPHAFDEICQKHEVKSYCSRQLTRRTRPKISNHRYFSPDQTNDAIQRCTKSANQCSVNITSKKLPRASQFAGKEVLSKHRFRKQNSYIDLELPKNEPLQTSSTSNQSIIRPALFDKSVLCKALSKKVKSGVVVESPVNLTSRNSAFQQILKDEYRERDILFQTPGGCGLGGMSSKRPSRKIPKFSEKASMKAVSSKLLTKRHPYVQLEETYENPSPPKVDNILPGLPLTKAVSVEDSVPCFLTDTFLPTYSDKPARKIEAGRSKGQKMQSQWLPVINVPKSRILDKNDNARKNERVPLTASRAEGTATNGRSNLNTSTSLDARYRTINHPSGRLDIKDRTIHVFTEKNSLEDSRYGKQHNPCTSPSPSKSTRSNRSSNAFSDKDMSEDRHCNVNNHATDTVTGTSEQQQTANLLHPGSAPPSLSVGFTEPSVREADDNVARKNRIIMPANKKIPRRMSMKDTKARKASKLQKKLSGGENLGITITLTSPTQVSANTINSASTSDKRRKKTTARKPALSVKRTKAQDDHDSSKKRETEGKGKKIKHKMSKAPKQQRKTVLPVEERPESPEVDSSLSKSAECSESDSEDEEGRMTAVEEEANMMEGGMSAIKKVAPSVSQELIMADLHEAACLRPSLKESDISLLHRIIPPPEVDKPTTDTSSSRRSSPTPDSSACDTYADRKKWRAMMPGVLAGMKFIAKGERKWCSLSPLSSRPQEFLRIGLPGLSHRGATPNESLEKMLGSALERGKSSDGGHLSVARRAMGGGATAPSASLSGTAGVNRELEQKVKAWKKMMGHVPKSKEGKQKESVLERDIHSYQIFTMCKWMVQMEAHSRSRQRWASATKSVFFLCFVTRQMRERSFQLYLEQPTFLDIADSFNVSIHQSSKVSTLLDTVPYKQKLSQESEGFCLNWEMISILISEPKERTELQLSFILHNLQCIPSFCNFPLHTQRAIARLGRYLYSCERRVILREGHVPQNFYFILSGQVVVSLISQGEQKEGPAFRQTLNMLTKGAIFGESAILQQTRRNATVTARTELQLLYISLDDYISIFVPERYIDGVPQYIRFLSQQSWMKNWPVQLLHENTNKCYTRYFCRQEVIVADSTTSDLLYLIRSGTCQVMMLVHAVTTTWKDIGQLISKDIYLNCDSYRSMYGNMRLSKLQQGDDGKPLPRPLSASDIRNGSWERSATSQSLSRSYSVPKIVDVEAITSLTSKNTDDQDDMSFSHSYSAQMMNFLDVSQHDVLNTDKTEEIEHMPKSRSSPELHENAHHPADVKSMPVRPPSFTNERNVNANMRQSEETGTETEGTRDDGETYTHTSCPERSSSHTNISQQRSSLFVSSGSNALLLTSTGGQCSSLVIPVPAPGKKPTKPGGKRDLRKEAHSQPLPNRCPPRSARTRSRVWKKRSKQSCWAKRWKYLVPERCQPLVNHPVCAPVVKGPPVYVEIVTLKEGDVFGFDQLDMPACSQPKTHRVSLVSCGAEVIALKKRFFVQHADMNVQQAVHLATQPYPSPEEVVHEWRMELARDLWQTRLGDDFLLAREQKRQQNAYVFGRRW